MDVDAAEELSRTKANAEVKVNKRTPKKKRKETKKKPQKTSETIGQSLSESNHTASHEDFPGKLFGSQNKASEAEGTTPMLRENRPRSPSKVESYDRSKAVIIRGLNKSGSTVPSERIQNDLQQFTETVNTVFKIHRRFGCAKPIEWDQHTAIKMESRDHISSKLY